MAPGSPWENGYAESFHSKLRDEFLSREEFESVADARHRTTSWREDYNEDRPHSSLGYLTPRAFARRCAASAAEPSSPPAQPSPPLQQHNDLTQPVLS
jgi:putative transposase